MAKQITEVYPTALSMYLAYQRCADLKSKIFLIYDHVTFNFYDPKHHNAEFHYILRHIQELQEDTEKKQEQQEAQKEWAYISIKIYESFNGKLGAKE